MLTLTLIKFKDYAATLHGLLNDGDLAIDLTKSSFRAVNCR